MKFISLSKVKLKQCSPFFLFFFFFLDDILSADAIFFLLRVWPTVFFKIFPRKNFWHARSDAFSLSSRNIIFGKSRIGGWLGSDVWSKQTVEKICCLQKYQKSTAENWNDWIILVVFKKHRSIFLFAVLWPCMSDLLLLTSPFVFPG